MRFCSVTCIIFLLPKFTSGIFYPSGTGRAQGGVLMQQIQLTTNNIHAQREIPTHESIFMKPLRHLCQTLAISVTKSSIKFNEVRDAEQIEKLNADKMLHDKRAKIAYALIKNFVGRPNDNPSVAAISIDLQQALPIPKINSGIQYHKKKLWTYHFGIHNIVTGKVSTYIWDETVGKRGSSGLAKEQRLRVFENKVLRKIFGAKRDDVTGEWKKLHNAELHIFSSSDIIRNIKSRRLRWAGHVARMGESRNAYSVLVGRPEEKRPLGRPRRRWENNIKMDLREVGYDDRDWINLVQAIPFYVFPKGSDYHNFKLTQQNEPQHRSGPGGDMWRDYTRQDGPMQSRCGTPTSERKDRQDHGSDGQTCLPKRRGNNGRREQRTEFCGKN
ncbi:hypothetical protein ANN_08306 [Periplaneta americana]|uniref:Uncharacterized protein n=1 Tax=Periplaneta americana TaxID=6978 RepID=A0ABQ8T1Q2_PERAM|nr:hypothetical protein ANN_08306 [Periplaneta americana]